MMATPVELLKGWLDRQLPASEAGWVGDTAARLARGGGDRDFYLAVSLAARKVGKHDLALTSADEAAAEAARPGWRPSGWSTDQAARLVLVLAGAGDADRFATRLEALFRTGDVGELVTFYRGLPLYPGAERHLARAAEGARTNMKAVFDAVAHRNPYPAEHFPEGTWNHMVLKALFIGSPLHPMQGLEERSNPALMRMLCDYAHERWAAKRSVSHELWRCVGPHADDAAISDLERVLGSDDARERAAAALALSASRHPRAGSLLSRAPERGAIETGRLSWESLAQEE